MKDYIRRTVIQRDCCFIFGRCEFLNMRQIISVGLRLNLYIFFGLLFCIYLQLFCNLHHAWHVLLLKNRISNLKKMTKVPARSYFSEY